MSKENYLSIPDALCIVLFFLDNRRKSPVYYGDPNVHFDSIRSNASRLAKQLRLQPAEKGQGAIPHAYETQAMIVIFEKMKRRFENNTISDPGICIDDIEKGIEALTNFDASIWTERISLIRRALNYQRN